MPKRYIEVPGAVELREPITKKKLENKDGEPEVWNFTVILSKLMSNPKWAENYANMRSQEAIEVAYEEAISNGSGIMELAEEDWIKLKDAADNPRVQINGPMGLQLVPGYGLHPSMSRQILPLISPIMEAKTERPRPKYVQVDECVPTEKA